MDVSHATKPQIRAYSRTDRDACIAIFSSNLPRYFDTSELTDFEAFLESPTGDYFVVEIENRVVACGGFSASNGTGRLTWGMVSRDNQGTSIGKSLLAHRIDLLFLLPEVRVITIDTSQHTEGFFSRHGFRTTSVSPNGFGRGIDQVSMSLDRREWIARANNSFKPSPLRGLGRAP